MLAFYNFKNLSYNEYIKSLEEMTEERYFTLMQKIHFDLVHQTKQAKFLLNNAYIQLLDPKVLGINANWLVNSTTYEYANLMNKLNIGKQFPKEFLDNFYPLIGIVPLSSPNGPSFYDHIGV